MLFGALDNHLFCAIGRHARALGRPITVPAGDVQGLPVGISFFSTAYREPELIAMAFAFEQNTKARIVPQMLPTLELP